MLASPLGHNTDTTIIAGNGNDTLLTSPGLSLSDESSVTAGNGNDVVTASAYSGGPLVGNSFVHISLGNGNDTVTVLGTNSTIAVGNGNNTITSGGQSTITAGNGNNTINVGISDSVTVGHGHDTFVFNQTAPSQFGAVSISGFGGHDVIAITSAEASALGLTGNQQQMDSQLASLFHDTGAGGSAQLQLDSADTITLTNVHSAALNANDFHIV
jgi:Ca2+-binding RTX toxin-like protein